MAVPEQLSGREAELLVSNTAGKCSVGRVLGGFLAGAWRVLGGQLSSAWRMFGKSLVCAWRVLGGCFAGA